MRPFVDLAAQHAAIRAELLEAVGRVFDHGQFVLGPEVRALEAALAERLGARHVIAVGSGSDAMSLSFRALGIGPGDEVITVSHSFFATASTIAMVGATPVFVDVEPNTLLMDPDLIERAITPRTKAVLPVHLRGAPCDMVRIEAICRARGLALVEDCAQAIGARFVGRAVGTFGMGAFSLHPLKILAACGDAGFITTDDAERAQHLTRLRNLGLRDRDHVDEVADHSRLDTIQAAILLVKLRHLDAWYAARAAHAARYAEALGAMFRVVVAPEGAEPVATHFVLRVRGREGLIADMAAHGFELKVHYPVPIHRQRAFERYHDRPLPETERAADEIVSLPVHPELAPAAREELIAHLLAWGEANHGHR